MTKTTKIILALVVLIVLYLSFKAIAKAVKGFLLTSIAVLLIWLVVKYRKKMLDKPKEID